MKNIIMNFFEEHSHYRPSEEEDLFESGVLDSFGIVEFLTFIQDEFEKEIPIEDITEENFSRIKDICRLIKEQE